MGWHRTLDRREFLQRGAALGAFAALSPLAACGSGERSRSSSSKNNVVVIFADDMRDDEAQYMPHLSALMVDNGVTFTSARHNIALCSPARAGFLTGEYSMRHGVRSQQDFIHPEQLSKTLPVWMQDAGYHTGIIGKYFTESQGRNTPPGWDLRRQLANNQSQFDFSVWDGHTEVTPRADQSRYLREELVSFLETAKEPFFLWFTPTANHYPFQVPPGYESRVADLELPDRRERNASDKPEWLRAMPEIDETQLALVHSYQRSRVAELLALDDTLAEAFDALARRGLLESTIILFTSDNGIFLGEHRVPLLSKNLPYEEAVHVPCLMRAPGVPRMTIEAPVHMSIDLTATCVDVAAAGPSDALDGTSLLEVIQDPDQFNERPLLFDRDNRDDSRHLECPPAAGVFTKRRKLIRYDTTPGTYELYDLEQDPNELQNLAGDPAYRDERAALEATLDELLAS